MTQQASPAAPRRCVTACSASVPGPPTIARPDSASTVTRGAPTRPYCAVAVLSAPPRADAESAVTEVESPICTTEPQLVRPSAFGAGGVPSRSGSCRTMSGS
ncbi:hypothetical protein ACFOJ6_11840 [Gordonia humi]|uniref:hypothetical protein n=1 Tax=Gordonia humi TaxID=686429 RepID=UPI003621AFAA